MRYYGTFYAVGQGLFFGAKCSDDNKPFNFVYDCGALSDLTVLKNKICAFAKSSIFM